MPFPDRLLAARELLRRALEETLREPSDSLASPDAVKSYLRLFLGGQEYEFPEGGLTSDGEIAPFRQGVEHILARRQVPVVPLANRGLWGSIFSRRDSAPGRMRLPRRFWSRIVLAVGEPVAPADASAAMLEQRVRTLRGNWA